MKTPMKRGGKPSLAQPIKITPSRRVAFEILSLVEQGRGHSDELLYSPRMEELSPEDRNLAMALVMGVLRWWTALDARIRPLLANPDQPLPPPVALTLRMGAFQLLHMDRIPAHAALSESVEMTKAAHHAHAAGMVNAILHKLVAAPRPGAKVYESVAAFSERLGHPRWLVERWVTNYGRDVALAICEAGQHEPGDKTFFTESAEDVLPAIDDGSRLVAELAAVAAPAETKSIWDTCAAPGGKTLVLAYRQPEAGIVATDVSPRRLEHMQARLRRYEYAAKVECSVADATKPGDDTLYDLILLDAPCSGTGTLARNPEIRHRLEPVDLLRQGKRQRELLNAALKRLAPGGRLVYSTCSLEPEENEKVLMKLPAERLPIEPFLQQLGGRGILKPEVTEMLLKTAVRDGALRTLPGVHPCDGFFAAVFTH